MMDDENDDMNCCSEYFYLRYAGESTLIDLTMSSQSYPEKNGNSLLAETDQSFFNRILAYIKSYSSCLGILILILCLYLFIHYFIQSNPSESTVQKL